MLALILQRNWAFDKVTESNLIYSNRAVKPFIKTVRFTLTTQSGI